MRHFYLVWTILFLVPMGVFAQFYSEEEQNEIQMANQQILELPNWNMTFGQIDFGTEGVNEDFIPTAGATQTFSPEPGDFFYDTGGPGGGGLNASGGPGTELPGNYLNCNCITTTTLAGVTEIEFHEFEVFGDFDWLKVYDGPNTSGAVLYDSNTNSNTDTFAGMIALNGSGVFTGTTGSITFEFRASGVVDHTGWEVEILGEGGGEETEYCDIITLDCEIEKINSVIFAGIENLNTGCGTAATNDFTDMVANVNRGGTYEMTVDIDADPLFPDDNAFFFIDWNQNGTLNDAGEVYEIVMHTGTSGEYSVDVTVPDDAVLGETRLRVGIVYNSGGAFQPLPCPTSDTATYGEYEDYTVNVSEGGSGGVDCGQGDDSNNFENGYQIGIGTDFENSDDFFVSADNTLNVQTIELNVLAMEPIESIDFTFRNDNGGAPGNTILSQTVTGLVPYDQVLIGGAFGYNVYILYVDVDLDFEGGASGTTYWMQPQATAAGGGIGGVFWEITSLGTLGSPIHTSEIGGPWMPDADGADAVFKLHCEDVDPPTPPCNYTITFDVEPITRVVVADIDNQSNPVVNGSPEVEDFTGIEGHMAQGETYDVAFEGNTGGNWTNFFTVFIDWNQDGDWTDDGEMYEIGSITNSTGTDGQQATGSISVPADALDGPTIMRVIKNYNAYATNPCATYGFGQAEDYTIIVGETPSNNEDCEQGDDSNNFENGYQIGIGTDFRNTDDFYVSAGSTLNIAAIEINVISMGGPIDSIDFTFYNDNAGSPGTTTVESVTGLIPISQEIIGTAFGFDVIRIVTEVELSFDGGATGTYYWMHPTATAAGGATGGVFWEITSLGTLGSSIHTSEANGPWTPDADGFDAVFTLHCEDLGASDMTSFDFAYYPNPVKDELNISSSKVVESVSIYNMAGQQVSAQKMTNSQGKVNTSALSPGVYLFRVVLQGGQVETFKIIKK